MKKHLTILLLTFNLPLLTFNLKAQPTIQWEKSYGSIATDRAFSIQQTTDNGFIIAGYSSHASGDVSANNGSSDYWVVKTDSIGNIEWEKSYGGSEIDVAQSIQQTTDGGYIVAGFSQSNDGDVTGHHGVATIVDCWIIKLDGFGNLLWEKSYGSNGEETANYIQQTTDGGYVFTGKSSTIGGDVTTFNGGMSDYWVVKTDSLGNIQWQKSFGGTGDEEANSVQQTKNGGYIVAGSTSSNDGDVTGFKGGNDYWVIMMDSLGNILWQKTYGGSNGDQAKSIRQTPDGGFFIAGDSNSNDGDNTGNPGGGIFTIWGVKINVNGNLIWEKAYLNVGVSVFANDIFELTNDGGYIISGGITTTSSFYVVVKADSLGTEEWRKQMGGSNVDEALTIRQTSDGGYIVTGFSSSSDGDVSFNNGSNDYWVVKLDAVVGIEENKYNNDVKLFPNPSNTGIINITAQHYIDDFVIYNGMGKIVDVSKNVNANQFEIDLSNQPPGMYFVVIDIDGQLITKKIIYQP